MTRNLAIDGLGTVAVSSSYASQHCYVSVMNVGSLCLWVIFDQKSKRLFKSKSQLKHKQPKQARCTVSNDGVVRDSAVKVQGRGM